ncbi:hypothetical protein EYC80_008602 [Monilinia laxa]|uniref:Uncharacterized protein n=1 Tax=Monilinia laxa TaxID=61186 RepID=A0A5N6K191_MONLA|nr:hypothetical protein EYC80_008602 [Monilinia laxa]
MHAVATGADGNFKNYQESFTSFGYKFGSPIGSLALVLFVLENLKKVYLELLYNNERAFQYTNFHSSFSTRFSTLPLKLLLSSFIMASSSTSSTRRVLGDININISASAFDIDHAVSIAKIPKVSESDGSLRNSPDLSKVVRSSTDEIQQENRGETDKILQVGSLEGEVEEEILSKGIEKVSEDFGIPTSVYSSESAQLAGRKRSSSGSGDAPEGSETHIRCGSGKKRKMEIQQSSVDTSSTDNLLPYNDTIQGKEGWTETCSRVPEDASGYNYGSSASLTSPLPTAQIIPSPVSSVSATSSSCSIEDTEDIATVPNSPQASETVIPDNPHLTPTTVSTRSFRTSKSKALSREDIRQKSQALRLRLSLANYKHARLRPNPSYGASTGSRTPLPGAPTSNDRSALIPVINLQRPSPSSKGVRLFMGGREKDRNKDVDIPSSSPSSRSDSLSRRDSAISCTSLASNSASAASHAHPLTSQGNEKNRDLDINMEQEVARRKREMMRERERENVLERKPILERQKLGILHPPMMFAQPDLGSGIERSDRGRSPELSRKAADGLLRLSLLR